MVTSLSFSVLKTRGEEWFSHTIPFCFHHPCMTPRYPNTDSNMTCHSERAMPLGIAASLPTTQLREGAQQPSCLHALSSVHAGCKPSNPTLAHPQPKPLLSPGSTHSHSFTFFCIGYLLVIDSQSRCCHSCITFPFLHCSYDICLSLYHSTNSSNKTGPNEKKQTKTKMRHKFQYITKLVFG